jgi:hypothetical protein
MQKMLLLEENIDSLKIELRNKYAFVKSAHLTEAIARALGFNSNAAMREAIRTSKKPKITLSVFDEDIFLVWLAGKGYQLYQPTEQEWHRVIDTPIWLVGRSESIAETAFYHAERLNIPAVYIVQRRKYADVHWDFDSVDEWSDPNRFISEDGHKLVELLRRFNGKYGKWSMGLAVSCGTIHQLKIEDARIVADEVFSILHNLISPKSWRDAA